MRLWSLHPKYLDYKGLVALWKSALLAQRIYNGIDHRETYQRYPQALRFYDHDPFKSIGYYLQQIWWEGVGRGCRFNRNLIECCPSPLDIKLINVSAGQMNFEAELLQATLRKRNLKVLKRIDWKPLLDPHPLFTITNDMNVEPWEKNGLE